MIYLVRHGQTHFNAEGRMQGHLDSPLTALGRAQASAIGRLLRDLIGKADGWRLVSSPLGRAQD
ncbi:MAG: phosphoglycerate mutase family protein, partial [Phenylobacterium sp.]